MNFLDLQKIVEYLEEAVTCPHCNGHYKAEQLNIVATTPEEVLFYTTCEKCKVQVMINVSLVPEKSADEPITENLQIQTTMTKGITKDDFLDMKNFLEQFNGDFKALFSK